MKLHLDFLRQRQARLFSWILLALGIIVAIATATTYARLSQELTDESVRRSLVAAKAKQNRSSVDEKGARTEQAEIERVAEVMDELAKPWHALFDALETTQFERVALLSVQPDAEHRALTLTGEAQSYADLLTYVARLKQKRVFTSVQLASHEIRDGDPFRPYVFTARADWKSHP